MCASAILNQCTYLPSQLPCLKYSLWNVHDFLILKEIVCDFGLLGRLELCQGKLAEYWYTFGAVFEPSGT